MRQEKNRRGSHDGEDEVTEPTPSGQDRRDRLNDDTEATLEEIDDILEENAEDFVRSYVQKGGQ